jgi:hypothetical protein
VLSAGDSETSDEASGLADSDDAEGEGLEQATMDSAIANARTSASNFFIVIPPII